MAEKQPASSPFTPQEPTWNRFGIRTRLLALALGAILVTIVVTTVVGYDLARNVIRQAQQTSSDSLQSQAEAYLVQINSSIAAQNNLILDRARKDVQAAAESCTAVFNGDLPPDYKPAKDQLVRREEGQLMNTAEDVASVFIPNTQVFNDQLAREVELSAYLDFVFPAIQGNNPDAAAIYFGTEQNLTRYYPNIMLGEVVPADFRVSERPWYLAAKQENAEMSSPEPVWSSVYQDATGLGLVTTIAMPVLDSSKNLIGVVGLDLTLDEISRNIQTARFLKTGYSFLVDSEGHAIVLPDQGYQDLLNRQPEENEFGADLNNLENAAFANVIGKMRRGETGFERIQSDGKELFVAFAPLESTGWSLGSIVTAEEVLQSITDLEQRLQQETRTMLFSRVVPIGLIISFALLIITIFLTNRLVNPIRELALAAQQIGAGRRQVEIPALGNDEIGFLARTLDRMADQISQSFDQLETRVAERTEQLEKRTLQIQTAAEVARDINQSGDLDLLLENAVNLISNRFGYYNVGIFLVDETGEFAHLRVASGDLGKMLLDQNIRLRVGQQGIIGYVTQFGQARISNDVRADELYQAEPLLADTRSEAAIPLLSGGRAQSSGPRAVIGALDVQSTQVNDFTPDDITVLQVLADHLAIAIQNIRLVNQLQTALKELNLVSYQQTKEAWRRFSGQAGKLAYVYDRMEVKPALPLDMPRFDPAANIPADGTHRLMIPIRLREQVIGLIGLEKDDPDHPWTDDEVAVLQAAAEQAALTVENARLLEESQRRAVREQIAGEITARMRASLELETVLRTALNEIGEQLGISQIEVQLEAGSPKHEPTRPESSGTQNSHGGNGLNE